MSEHQQILTAVPEHRGTPRDQPAPFRCTCSARGVGAAWVLASGELDAAGAPLLAQALRDAQSSARLVVVDLCDLTFIDTAGVHVLVDASVRALLDGRRLLVARPAAHIAKVFALTGTSDAVEMFDIDPVDRPFNERLRLVPAETTTG